MKVKILYVIIAILSFLIIDHILLTPLHVYPHVSAQGSDAVQVVKVNPALIKPAVQSWIYTQICEMKGCGPAPCERHTRVFAHNEREALELGRFAMYPYRYPYSNEVKVRREILAVIERVW